MLSEMVVTGLGDDRRKALEGKVSGVQIRDNSSFSAIKKMLHLHLLFKLLFRKIKLLMKLS
jgi:hypothetical protein